MTARSLLTISAVLESFHSEVGPGKIRHFFNKGKDSRDSSGSSEAAVHPYKECLDALKDPDAHALSDLPLYKEFVNLLESYSCSETERR